MLLVVVAEDGASELFHLPDDVPRAVLADGFHDVLQYPLQHDIAMGKPVDKPVHGLLLHLRVVETHAQIGRQV